MVQMAEFQDGETSLNWLHLIQLWSLVVFWGFFFALFHHHWCLFLSGCRKTDYSVSEIWEVVFPLHDRNTGRLFNSTVALSGELINLLPGNIGQRYKLWPTNGYCARGIGGSWVMVQPLRPSLTVYISGNKEEFNGGHLHIQASSAPDLSSWSGSYCKHSSLKDIFATRVLFSHFPPVLTHLIASRSWLWWNERQFAWVELR